MFVVEPETVPAGVVALLGVTDIHTLGISLDAVMEQPDPHRSRHSLSSGSREYAVLSPSVFAMLVLRPAYVSNALTRMPRLE